MKATILKPETYQEVTEGSDNESDTGIGRTLETKRVHWWNNPVSRDNALIAMICTFLIVPISSSLSSSITVLHQFVLSLSLLYLYHEFRGVQTRFTVSTYTRFLF